MTLRRALNNVTVLLLGSMFLFSCRHIKVVAPPKSPVNIGQNQVQEGHEKAENPLTNQDEAAVKKALDFPEAPPKKVPAKKTELSIVLNYFRYIHSLSEEELAAEFQRTEQEFSESDAPIHLIRLAMLSGLTQTKHSSAERASALLKIYLSEPRSKTPALRDFAFLLAAVIKQNERQMLQNDKQNKALNTFKKDNNNLKKIIEALKNIEQNIINKEQ